MSDRPAEYSIGVEEEFHVADPATRAQVPDAGRVLAQLRPILDGASGDEQHHEVESELNRSQIETNTPVCDTLDGLRAELVRLRREVIAAADRAERLVVAAGSLPCADWREQSITDKPRYRMILETYRQLAREQLVCGCHVHIGFPSREAAIEVLNRCRPWLPTLLALSGASPYWAGNDTGYASYRTTVWGRWPSADIPPLLAGRADFDARVQALIDTGTILDRRMLYWDARPSSHLETLEFRVADSCTRVDEAVLQAGLCRALSRTCADEAARGLPLPDIRPELLRAAKWRAARHGIAEDLLDPVTQRRMPAARIVRRLLDYLRPALELDGDWEQVDDLAARVLRDGTSADRQRRAFERTGSLTDVTDHLQAETAREARAFTAT